MTPMLGADSISGISSSRSACPSQAKIIPRDIAKPSSEGPFSIRCSSLLVCGIEHLKSSVVSPVGPSPHVWSQAQSRFLSQQFGHIVKFGGQTASDRCGTVHLKVFVLWPGRALPHRCCFIN